MIRRLGALAGLILVLAAASPAFADLKLPRLPRIEPPLHILRAKASDPACAPDCPEWLSVEGRIMPGSADAFARAVEALHGRKLPILLSSRGGSVNDAFQMGVLIREKGLSVAVARTQILGCPERNPACPTARAVVTVGGAVCASACPLILAGGVERIAGPAAEIGVHQITTMFKEPTGSIGLTTTRKIYEDSRADFAVERYLAFMGIGEPVMTLLRRTPAGGIRWLSPEELRASGALTATLDAAEPMLMSGANGLNAYRPGGAPAALIAAEGRSGDDLPAKARLAYRPGGGALEMTLSGTEAGSLSVALGDGSPLAARPGPDGKPRAQIPRSMFCALGSKGRIVVTPAPSGAPTVFEIADMKGIERLTAQACP